MRNITDYRDAFILWILADLNLLVAGALVAHAPNYSTPIAAAMIATAVTGYTAAVGLMVLSALSIIAGYRKAGGNNA
jgi:ABC-type uncharacterized transport system permease subunit